MAKQSNLTSHTSINIYVSDAGERREAMRQGEISIMHSSDQRAIKENMIVLESRDSDHPLRSPPRSPPGHLQVRAILEARGDSIRFMYIHVYVYTYINRGSSHMFDREKESAD